MLNIDNDIRARIILRSQYCKPDRLAYLYYDRVVVDGGNLGLDQRAWPCTIYSTRDQRLGDGAMSSACPNAY